MTRLLCAIVAACSIVTPAAAADTIDAVWQEQDFDFTFISFVTAYSCDVMEGKIEILLRHVGAEDIHVSIPSCGGFKRPQRQLRIIGSFSTLVPAGDAEGDGEIVKARWSEVELGKYHPRSIDDRDCELLEQFQEYLLSTIDHEVIEGVTGCGASKLSVIGRLKLKVLEPVPAPEAAATDQ